MGFSTSTCTEFVEVLASKAPVPGGGGASALVGAVGTALGNMVGSLTVGKKKYADVEEEMWELKGKCDQLQKDFLRLIERDAEVFEPLSKAYGMPKETEEEKAEKARVMAIVLKDACSVPMEIMEKCCEALDLIKEFAAKGSKLAISDAGVAATFCKAALKGASLNVYINTKSMADREYAEEHNLTSLLLLLLILLPAIRPDLLKNCTLCSLLFLHFSLLFASFILHFLFSGLSHQKLH